MGLEVHWTPRAKKNLDSLKKYLAEEWSENVAEAFENRVKEFTEVLSEFPSMGSLEVETKGIRGFQIVKQVRIFYRLKTNRIIILSLFSSKQHPRKKPK